MPIKTILQQHFINNRMEQEFREKCVIEDVTKEWKRHPFQGDPIKSSLGQWPSPYDCAMAADETCNRLRAERAFNSSNTKLAGVHIGFLAGCNYYREQLEKKNG